MIQDPDLNGSESGDQEFRDRSVCGTGFSNTAWMVVNQHHRGGIGPKDRFDDFAGVDARAVQRSLTVLGDVKDPVAIVQKAQMELFVLQVAQPHA